MRASEVSSRVKLQRVGRLTAICLADSGWPVPAMVRTFDFSCSPLYVDGEKLVLVARATSSRNPKASDPRWTFVSWETSLSVRWLHALIRVSILRRTGRSLFVWSPLVAESWEISLPQKASYEGTSVVLRLGRLHVWTSARDTWLILPVVICLSQRLSHACLSTSLTKVKPRMAH